MFADVYIENYGCIVPKLLPPMPKITPFIKKDDSLYYSYYKNKIFYIGDCSSKIDIDKRCKFVNIANYLPRVGEFLTAVFPKISLIGCRRHNVFCNDDVYINGDNYICYIDYCNLTISLNTMDIRVSFGDMVVTFYKGIITINHDKRWGRSTTIAFKLRTVMTFDTIRDFMLNVAKLNIGHKPTMFPHYIIIDKDLNTWLRLRTI